MASGLDLGSLSDAEREWREAAARCHPELSDTTLDLLIYEWRCSAMGGGSLVVVPADRPAPGEVCPSCGSANITLESGSAPCGLAMCPMTPRSSPPMSCADCGDRWAGLYRSK